MIRKGALTVIYEVYAMTTAFHKDNPERLIPSVHEQSLRGENAVICLKALEVILDDYDATRARTVKTVEGEAKALRLLDHSHP